MKKSTLFLFCMAIAVAVHSQRSIAVQNNGTANFYYDWATAWQNTDAGDTIYLPGATFSTGNVDIDKPVTIIGIGHDTAYVYNKLFSYLKGGIRMLKGAEGTVLHGFQVDGVAIGTNTANDSVTNISISRCKIGSLTLGYNDPSPANHIFINECVLGGVAGRNAKHIQFHKNIIDGLVSGFNGNTVFSNNIFTYGHSVKTSYYPPLNNVIFCFFQNNIFKVTFYPLSSSSNNTFDSNIFVANLTIDPQTDLNVWENNFFNQPLTDIFVNYTGGSYLSNNNYHLKPGSVGINAGTDGTDIGIYGTAVPYKEGAVPFTPRIIQDSVSKQTDEEGKINIQVQVEAQTR